MAAPIWQTADFSPAPCLPCCSTPTPSDCSCALLIPPFASPYADLTTAQTAITDQTDNCIGYVDYGGGNTSLSFAAAFDGTTITGAAHTEFSAPTLAVRVDSYFSVSMLSGATVSVPWTVSTDGPATYISVSLMDCTTGVEVAGDIVPPDAGGSGTMSFVVPNDGEFVLLIRGGGTLGLVTYATVSFTVTCDMVYTVNPVIALWDDSGTTRSLWACPKLLLPPLTEATGDWYASCADAGTVLTDPLQVSNCVGFCDESLSSLVSSFSATGGTDFSFSANFSIPFIPHGIVVWASINAVAGDLLTVSFTGSTDAKLNIYADDGSLIEALDTASTSATSSPLPYTGRYIVAVTLYSTVGHSWGSGTGTVASSGTMSVNEIQARYDLGLTCAGTLNCGDSCP